MWAAIGGALSLGLALGLCCCVAIALFVGRTYYEKEKKRPDLLPDNQPSNTGTEILERGMSGSSGTSPHGLTSPPTVAPTTLAAWRKSRNSRDRLLDSESARSSGQARASGARPAEDEDVVAELSDFISTHSMRSSFGRHIRAPGSPLRSRPGSAARASAGGSVNGDEDDMEEGMDSFPMGRQRVSFQPRAAPTPVNGVPTEHEGRTSVWAAQHNFLERRLSEMDDEDDADSNSRGPSPTPSQESVSRLSATPSFVSYPTWLRKAHHQVKSTRDTSSRRSSKESRWSDLRTACGGRNSSTAEMASLRFSSNIRAADAQATIGSISPRGQPPGGEQSP